MRINATIVRTRRVAALALFVAIGTSPAATGAPSTSTIVVSSADPGVGDYFAGMNVFSSVVQARTSTPPVHVTWDDLPDSVASPNDFPPEYLRDHADYGITFATIGNGRFRVSAALGNAAHVPPLFGDVSPAYATQFIATSPSQIFAPLDGNTFEIEFFERGTGLPAVVDGLGAVFTGVDDSHSTTIEFFHGSTSLGKFPVPPGRTKVPSFLGVSFPNPVVSRVVVAGAGRLGDKDMTDGGTADVFAMDDLLYEDPVVSADLKTYAMTAVREGDVVTYSTLVYNRSDALAQRAIVRQTFPPDVHVITTSPAVSPTPTILDGVVTWDYESMPRQQSTTYVVVVGVDAIGLHPSSLTATAYNDPDDANDAASIAFAPSACVDDGTIASLECRLLEFRAIVDSLGLKKSVAKPLRNPIVKAASQTAAAVKRAAKGRTVAAGKLVRAAHKTLDRVRTALYSRKSAVIAQAVRDTLGQWTYAIQTSMQTVAGN
jgi:uncharacterized repeat protein (TIGR01451 family)